MEYSCVDQAYLQFPFMCLSSNVGIHMLRTLDEHFLIKSKRRR